MAVSYKVYKSNRKGTGAGMYYARAAHRDTVTVKDLAQTMEANSTVKRSDILAVLAELSETMKAELQRSNRVRIDGLGTFKIGLTTKPAKTAKDFTANKNVSGVHIVFLPEITSDSAGKRVKTLLAGVRVQEAGVYTPAEDEAADTAQATASTDDMPEVDGQAIS